MALQALIQRLRIRECSLRKKLFRFLTSPGREIIFYRLIFKLFSNLFGQFLCSNSIFPERCSLRHSRVVETPWARAGSGFTLLFEAVIMALSKAMPVATIGEFVNEHDTRLWRIIHHYVDKGRADADCSEVKQVGFDETSSKRGHNCVSLFVDLDGPNILFATEGKDSSTV